MTERVGNEASEAWRNHVLKQVVNYLEPTVIPLSTVSKPTTRST